MTRKNRASGGKELSQKVRYVRRQDGSEGCSVAHDKDVMSGCAWEESGATPLSEGGSTSFFGNMVGEI